MTETRTAEANEASRAAWNANAAYWDDYMGSEGNSFVRQLIWPAVQELMAVRPGQRILDAACGNGMYTRKLAALRADAVGFDFAENLIDLARTYPAPDRGSVDYLVADATDEAGLLALGPRSFDGASCQMALFDMPVIAPLMRAVSQLLLPGGAFVVSITHPAFNQAGTVRMAEMIDQEGELITRYSVKIDRYMSSYSQYGIAIDGQPEAQPYFDRPLQDILAPAFAAGFVLDGLLERAYPPGDDHGKNPLSWGSHFSEIPPVMVLRFRLPVTA